MSDKEGAVLRIEDKQLLSGFYPSLSMLGL